MIAELGAGAHPLYCKVYKQTYWAGLKFDNKKSHDGQCPSRRVTGGDGEIKYTTSLHFLLLYKIACKPRIYII